jgi:hypothetical protein
MPPLLCYYEEVVLNSILFSFGLHDEGTGNDMHGICSL